MIIQDARLQNITINKVSVLNNALQNIKNIDVTLHNITVNIQQKNNNNKNKNNIRNNDISLYNISNIDITLHDIFIIYLLSFL